MLIKQLLSYVGVIKLPLLEYYSGASYKNFSDKQNFDEFTSFNRSSLRLVIEFLIILLNKEMR